jgi:hypothetical protein
MRLRPASLLRALAHLGRRTGGRHGERGQSLVEFSLILPIFMFLLLIMLEFGMAFNHSLTIGIATREGARVGAALARGDDALCGTGDPSFVDEQMIASVQRVLKSPGSDVVMSDISQIRIFKATSTGAESGTSVNIWTYTPGAGPDADHDVPVDRLDFSPPASAAWPACSRVNTGTNPDGVGVAIRYTYHLQTALSGFTAGILRSNNQPSTIGMNDQTVMVLNPTN